MKTETTETVWYAAKMGNDHQGLVIDEKTGVNIAVTYDKKDAPLVAAAPELWDALHDLLDIVQAEYADDPEPEDLPSWKRAIEKADAVIAKVNEGAQ